MARTYLVASRGNSGVTGVSSAAGPNYWWLGHTVLAFEFLEIRREVTWQVTGILSKLYIRVIANSTTASSTFNVRKNGTDGNLTLTIAAGATGEFEYSGATDTVAPDDEICFRTLTGAGGTLTVAIMSVIFDTPDDKSISKLIIATATLSTPSALLYNPIGGNRSGASGTESNAENTIKKAGTAKNAFAYVSTNARTTNTLFTLRKNRADTTIIITIPAGLTGFFEDISHTVSYAVDDEINWKQTSGLGSENITFQTLSLDYESTGYGLINSGSIGASADITIGPSITNYYVIGGGMIEGVTTEADAQLKVREGCTLSNLTVYARANTITAASTVKLRINGAYGTQVCTIGSSATGFIVDTTHTDVVQPGDEICLEVVTGGTGTTLTIAQLGIWAFKPSLLKTLSETETIGDSKTRTKAAWRLQP